MICAMIEKIQVTGIQRYTQRDRQTERSIDGWIKGQMGRHTGRQVES